MKQMIDDPRINPVDNVILRLKERWFQLSMSEQILYQTEFIEMLKREYHKDFFRRINPVKIIDEMWFQHFMFDKWS